MQEISESFGINPQIIRYIIHEYVYPPGNAVRLYRQPFRFIKSKYISHCDYQFLLKGIPDEVKTFYQQNVDQHKNMSYEDRANQMTGLKITYPVLKEIYDSVGITRQMFKAPSKVKTHSTDFQIQQLLALELADVKIKRENIYYVDAIMIQQKEYQLTLTSYDLF